MEESFPIVPVLRNDHCLHSKFVREMCRAVLQDRRHCFCSYSGYCVMCVLVTGWLMMVDYCVMCVLVTGWLMCVVFTRVRVVDDGRLCSAADEGECVVVMATS